MATPEQQQLLTELWTVGMKVPDLVRKVQRRVPLRTVQTWARARRLTDAGATSDSGADPGTAPKQPGKRRKLPSPSSGSSARMPSAAPGRMQMCGAPSGSVAQQCSLP